MIDDDQIRTMLEARAASPDRRLTDVARAVAAAHPRGTARQALRSPFSFVAGTAVLAAVALVLIVLPGRSLRPDTTRTSPPPFAATSDPSVNATMTPTPLSWEALTWYSGDDGQFERPGRNVFIQAVLHWRGAWIAVGSSLDLTSHHVAGLILHSDDGLTWRRDPDQADVQFDRLLSTPDEIFIVGSHREPDVGDRQGPTQPAIWASSDGRRWTEVSLPAGIDRQSMLLDVAIGGRGWLLRAIGVDGERWLVGNPNAGWKDVDLADGAFPNAYVHGVVGTDDGWMAYGATGADRGSNSGFIFGNPDNDRGAIWVSTDASTWTAAQLDNAGTSVGAIHRVSRGWIARGGDHGGCPRCVGRAQLLWRSDDGQTWTHLGLPTSHEYAMGWGGIASDGQRGLLFDLDSSRRLRIRETEDGVDWSVIDVFIDASAKTIEPTTGGVVGVGADAVVSFVGPSTSSLGHSWMAPQVAIAGTPPATAATQSPAPPP